MPDSTRVRGAAKVSPWYAE